LAQDILSVEAISKFYGLHLVIDHLSFRLRRGQRMALYAPSGAGKTTLIKILAGLESCTSGRFVFHDAGPVTIFQEPRLFAYMTVEENILLPFKLHKTNPSTKLLQEYRRWLEVCDLGTYTGYYPWQLSGGMKQKVTLIRGLLGSPAFIMMDEPFQSIGADSKKAIIEHIKAAHPETTMLFVTHIADEVPLLAETVLYFQESVLSHPLQVEADNFHLAQPVFDKASPELTFTPANKSEL